MILDKLIPLPLRFPKRSLRSLLLPDATLSARSISCPVCGLRSMMPPLRQGHEAFCPRCQAQLVRIEREPYILPIAYALAALVLLLIVSFNFYLGVTMPGAQTRLTLPGMMYELLHSNVGFMANLMFLFVFATPLIFLLLVLYVYAALLQKQARPFLLAAVRLLFRLRLWLMVDIFSISSLVALVKINALAQTSFGTAFFAIFIYSLLLARVVLGTPPYWLYNQIAKLLPNKVTLPNTKEDVIACQACHMDQPAYFSRCSLCGSRLHKRQPYTLRLATAFLIAAMLFYLPANLLPMMITANPMTTISSHIIDGVVTLWRSQDYLVAVIIFIASVVIPLFKIVGMLLLLVCAKFHLFLSAQSLSRLYQVISLIGRWSMIDIFVMMLLMAVFNTSIARVTAGPAAFYFTLVVILTMLSTHFFDTRLLWDKEAATSKQHSSNHHE